MVTTPATALPKGMTPPPVVPIIWGRSFDPESSRTTLAEIVKVCARHGGISVAELNGARRAQAASRPRHVAMYLATKHTGRSLPEIGRRMGGRDHSTIIHGRNKVQEDLDDGGKVFGKFVAHVERELGVG